RAALGFLDAIAAWERDPVLEALAGPWLWPADDAAHDAAFPYLARRSQVIAGLSEWRQALRGLEKRLGKDRALQERLPDADAAIGAMLQRFAVRAEQAGVFPRTAASAAYAGRMLERLRDWPLRGNIARRCGAKEAEAELRGLEAVERALRLIAASPAKAA